MYSYSKSSKEKLRIAAPELQSILEELIKLMDVKIVCTYRNEVEQTLAYNSGFSKKKFPGSKHNRLPARAVDVAPYPIDWNNTQRFYYMAGLIKGIAAAKGIKIRGGWDWDGDGDITDQTFNDLAHFELEG